MDLKVNALVCKRTEGLKPIVYWLINTTLKGGVIDFLPLRVRGVNDATAFYTFFS